MALVPRTNIPSKRSLAQLARYQELSLQKDKHSIRYQLITGHIERQTYIDPIECEVYNYGYGDHQLSIGDPITDDPHYLTLGWLSELGIPNIIKCTNKQIDAMYRLIHDIIYPEWENRILANRKGYKLGLIAGVDKPFLGRNYDAKLFSSPVLVEWNGDHIVMRIEKYMQYSPVQKHSRTKTDWYLHSSLSIDRNGTIVNQSTSTGYYSHGTFVLAELPNAY